jgi:hypothetical protein
VSLLPAEVGPVICLLTYAVPWLRTWEHVLMGRAQDVIAAEGLTPDGDTWSLLYRPEGAGGRHYIALLLNGGVNDEGSGLDLPDTTEIGFIAGMKPGIGQFYLFGLVTSRIQTVRAESHEEQYWSEVPTSPLPEATTKDGSPLRSFVLVRPPVDDVTALVGLGRDGVVVQRIPLLPLTEP